VLVSNHPSFVDGLALLLSLPEPVAFVSSTDFERQWLAGALLRHLGCAFVHRDDPTQAQADTDRLVEIVRCGRTLVVFPEGSIARTPGMRRFHLGAFAVAAAAGCPVVPMGISGTRDVVRPGSYLPRRGAVAVAFGDAVEGPGSDFAAQVAWADRLKQAVGALAEGPTER